MCGVGTFLVEGAMIAADMAPTSTVNSGVHYLAGPRPALWKKLHAEATERAAIGMNKPPLWVRGYEADPRLIQPARNNIERAGLIIGSRCTRAKSARSSRARTRTRKAWSSATRLTASAWVMKPACCTSTRTSASVCARPAWAGRRRCLPARQTWASAWGSVATNSIRSGTAHCRASCC